MSFESSSNFGRPLKPDAHAKEIRCYSFACASGFSLVACTLVLLTGLVCGCSGGGNSSAGEPSSSAAGDIFKGRLILTGSSTVAPLIAEVAKQFEHLHPDVRVDVQSGGSSRGISDARSGTADIGMSSRALTEEESKDLVAHQIATDGICVIVHKDNPVEELTDTQVVSIYVGEYNNWKEVGGRDEPIVVINKADGRATLDVFLGHFKLDTSKIQADVVIGDNQQGIKTVAGNPHAIGYVSIGAADYESRHGTAIKLLKAGGIAPNSDSVAAGKFPMTRPLNLVTKGQPKSLAQAFIEFAQSKEVHDLVEAQYFVPLHR